MSNNTTSPSGSPSENYELKYMSLFYKMNDINTTQMKYKDDGQKYYKDPFDSNWKEYSVKEQSLDFVLNRNWEDAVGIGAVLGWGGLRAIDVDGFGEILSDSDDPFYAYESIANKIHANLYFKYYLEQFLSLLGLPVDYPWVTISGSNMGFHILFRCDDVDLQADSLSFAPSNNRLNSGGWPVFDHFELRWSDHLVLPPSLHKSGRKYLFRYNTPPTTKVATISITDIDRLLCEFCGIRTFEKHKLKSGAIFEITEIQKCTSREGSYFTSPADYRGDTIDWLKKTNSNESKNSLALHYLFGKGEDKDIPEGIKLLKSTDCQSCVFNLASLYACGALKWDNDKFMSLMSTLDLKRFNNHIKLIEDNARSKCDVAPYYLFFDTETTGMPRDYDAPASELDNWPRLVQISWILTSRAGYTISKEEFIVRPDGFEIPSEASNVHGITTANAQRNGHDIKHVLNQFLGNVNKSTILVGHNIDYDIKVVDAELIRLWGKEVLKNKQHICTMKESKNFCKILDYYGRSYKYPKLQELYTKLFSKPFENAHDAMADVKATNKCFFEMKRLGIVS